MLLDSPGRYSIAAILLAEGLIVFILLALVIGLFQGPTQPVAIVEITVFLLLLQMLKITDLRLTPGYLLYLSHMSSEPAESTSTELRDNIFYMSSSLGGICRVGNFLSKGHFEDLVITRLKSAGCPSVPPTLSHLIDAIEMDIVYKATSAKKMEELVPFSEFNTRLRNALSSNAPTLAGLAGLFVQTYSSVPPLIAERAMEAHREGVPLADWFEKHSQLTRLVTWLLAVVAIVLLALVFEISIPVLP